MNIWIGLETSFGIAALELERSTWDCHVYKVERTRVVIMIHRTSLDTVSNMQALDLWFN